VVQPGILHHQRLHHPIRARLRLNRQGLPARHNAGLPHIGLRHGGDDLSPAIGVFVMLFLRLGFAQHARLGQQIRTQLMRADALNPGLLEKAQHRAQRRVVALLQRGHHARHQRHGGGVNLGRIKRRPRHAADKTHAVHALGYQFCDEAAERFDPKPDHRPVAAGGTGVPLQFAQLERGAVGLKGLEHQTRQIALACDNRQHGGATWGSGTTGRSAPG